MGNHEKLFLDYIETGAVYSWYMNGGQVTHLKIIEKGYGYQADLYFYIKKLPLYMVLDNNIICHAGLYIPTNYMELSIDQLLDMQDIQTLLWNRSNIGNERLIPGHNIICGHTPVQEIDGSFKKLIY